jgi:hypothetical protein
MQFALEVALDNKETHVTLYSKENQTLIAAAFNNGYDHMVVYHEIQEGLYAGIVVQHIIYLETRSVTIIGQTSKGRGKLKLVVLNPRPNVR